MRQTMDSLATLDVCPGVIQIWYRATVGHCQWELTRHQVLHRRHLRRGERRPRTRSLLCVEELASHCHVVLSNGIVRCRR
jgi:hypothetical protein